MSDKINSKYNALIKREVEKINDLFKSMGEKDFENYVRNKHREYVTYEESK